MSLGRNIAKKYSITDSSSFHKGLGNLQIEMKNTIKFLNIVINFMSEKLQNCLNEITFTKKLIEGCDMIVKKSDYINNMVLGIYETVNRYNDEALKMLDTKDISELKLKIDELKLTKSNREIVQLQSLKKKFIDSKKAWNEALQDLYSKNSYGTKEKKSNDVKDDLDAAATRYSVALKFELDNLNISIATTLISIFRYDTVFCTENTLTNDIESNDRQNQRLSIINLSVVRSFLEQKYVLNLPFLECNPLNIDKAGYLLIDRKNSPHKFYFVESCYHGEQLHITDFQEKNSPTRCYKLYDTYCGKEEKTIGNSKGLYEIVFETYEGIISAFTIDIESQKDWANVKQKKVSLPFDDFDTSNLGQGILNEETLKIFFQAIEKNPMSKAIYSNLNNYEKSVDIIESVISRENLKEKYDITYICATFRLILMNNPPIIDASAYEICFRKMSKQKTNSYSLLKELISTLEPDKHLFLKMFLKHTEYLQKFFSVNEISLQTLSLVFAPALIRSYLDKKISLAEILNRASFFTHIYQKRRLLFENDFTKEYDEYEEYKKYCESETESSSLKSELIYEKTEEELN